MGRFALRFGPFRNTVVSALAHGMDFTTGRHGIHGMAVRDFTVWWCAGFIVRRCVFMACGSRFSQFFMLTLRPIKTSLHTQLNQDETTTYSLFRLHTRVRVLPRDARSRQ